MLTATVSALNVSLACPNYHHQGHKYTEMNAKFLSCLISTYNQRYLVSHYIILANRNLHLIAQEYILTHWGRVTHICVSELTIIGSDNGLSPGRRQAIIWNNAGLLLIEPLGTNFSEILIEIHAFSFKKMHLNMSSAKWRPFCLGLNVLRSRI